MPNEITQLNSAMKYGQSQQEDLTDILSCRKMKDLLSLGDKLDLKDL